MAMTPIFGESFDVPNREEIPDREKNERALLDRVRCRRNRSGCGFWRLLRVNTLCDLGPPLASKIRILLFAFSIELLRDLQQRMSRLHAVGVTVHEEQAKVIRRAVSEPSYLKNIDWPDQIIEVTEMTEEPVVNKILRVAEEAGIGSTRSDRVDTVRGTLRRQQLDVE